MLTGSVASVGGTSPNGWNKFIPVPPKPVHPHGEWNDLTWPIEYPLAHHELSMLLPHFLKEGRGRLDTYFTRVYNPVWTNPDGFSWLEVLTDEELVGCHVALTPSWSETAWFADYVLPMGVGAERHDVASYETHTGRWIGFRQPVFKVFAEQQGRTVHRTWEVNPGEVWEENEWWIDLAFHIDPDGSLGIRGHFESVADPGQPMPVDEYYEHLFTHSIPGLPEAAAAQGLSPLQYMRRHGAFALPGDQHELHERAIPSEEIAAAGAERDDDGVLPGGRHRGEPRRAGGHRRAHALHRRRLGGRGDRRHRPGRVPDTVAQARAVLGDHARLGLAGVRAARPGSPPTSTGRGSTSRPASGSSSPRSASRR